MKKSRENTHFLKLKLNLQKFLKCKNPLKYFICNNFAFLVFLIMCQKDIYLNSRVSFESTLHLNYVKNLIYKIGT
jgi:hypothetical protein